VDMGIQHTHYDRGSALTLIGKTHRANLHPLFINFKPLRRRCCIDLRPMPEAIDGNIARAYSPTSVNPQIGTPSQQNT